MPNILKITIFVLFACLAAPHSPSHAAMPGIPQCETALKYMTDRKSAKYLAALVKGNCHIMYAKGWLSGKGKSAKICKAAWKNLEKTKTIVAAQAVVTRNCPYIYSQGWRKR